MLTRPHVKAKAKATGINSQGKILTLTIKAVTGMSVYACNTSCFVNEYLIPDYSLLKLDFSSYTH